MKILFLIMITMVIAVGAGSGQTADTNTKSFDVPVKIKKKPTAEIRGTNCSASEGVISIKVTFDKSAKVTQTEVIKSSGCPAFDDNAVRAAENIIFVPATKNGEPVTVEKIIEYRRKRY